MYYIIHCLVIWNETIGTPRKHGVLTTWCVCGYHAAVELLACERELKNGVGMYCSSKDRRFIGHWPESCHTMSLYLLVSKKRPSCAK